MDDDLSGKRTATLTTVSVGQDLANASVEELEERIDALNAEIARTQETLRKKKDVRTGAEALFRQKS